MKMRFKEKSDVENLKERAKLETKDTLARRAVRKAAISATAMSEMWCRTNHTDAWFHQSPLARSSYRPSPPPPYYCNWSTWTVRLVKRSNTNIQQPLEPSLNTVSLMPSNSQIDRHKTRIWVMNTKNSSTPVKTVTPQRKKVVLRTFQGSKSILLV